MRSGTLTYLIGDIKRLDLLGCALYKAKRRPSKPIEVVFTGKLASKDERSAMGLIFEDLEFNDGSKIGAVEDYFNDEMIYVAIAASAEAIERLHSRIRADRPRSCRYVIAVSPERAPALLHAASNLAFFHQPAQDAKSLVASAEYAVSLAESRKMDTGTNPVSRDPVRLNGRGLTGIDKRANDLLTLNFGMPLTRHGFRFDPSKASESGTHVLVSQRETGVVLYGPYLELGPGTYRVRWTVGPDKEGAQGLSAHLTLDVFHFDRKLGKRDVEIGADTEVDETYSIDFTVSPQSALRPIEFRVWQKGDASFCIKNITIDSIL